MSIQAQLAGTEIEHDSASLHKQQQPNRQE